MNCTNCALAIAPDAKFCDNCGTSLVLGARNPIPNSYPPSPGGQPIAVVAAVVRNPGLAMLLSIFFPGAGQIYNGQIGKGIGMFVGCVVCGALAFLIIPIFGALGIWLWAIVDAYQNAKTTIV